MQNETEPKKEWQTPVVVDLDVKDSKSSESPFINESTHGLPVGS